MKKNPDHLVRFQTVFTSHLVNLLYCKVFVDGVGTMFYIKQTKKQFYTKQYKKRNELFRLGGPWTCHPDQGRPGKFRARSATDMTALAGTGGGAG